MCGASSSSFCRNVDWNFPLVPVPRAVVSIMCSSWGFPWHWHLLGCRFLLSSVVERILLHNYYFPPSLTDNIAQHLMNEAAIFRTVWVGSVYWNLTGERERQMCWKHFWFLISSFHRSLIPYNGFSELKCHHAHVNKQQLVLNVWLLIINKISQEEVLIFRFFSAYQVTTKFLCWLNITELAPSFLHGCSLGN